MGKLDENGQWISISQAAREERERREAERKRKPPAPATKPKPPAEVDPGPNSSDDVLVDEWWVENRAREFLPDDDAFREYARLATEGIFRGLAAQVLEHSRVDRAAFAERYEAASAAIAAAETELNTKQAPPPSVGQPGAWEALPGVRPDPVCTSHFDVSDLALRGRKTVQVRRFIQPLVLTDAFVGDPPAPRTWRFGQRMEHQQEWRHAGFTLGELASSLSLLPGEELAIEVSNWQRTKTEIQTEQDTTTRAQMEEEQRRTDERTCTAAAAQDNGWSVNATGSVSYPVASASINAGVSGSSSERTEQTKRTLTEATTRSVAEESTRRAVKLTQTAEAGSQSTTTRRIRNPNTCHTVTFNFFQVVKLYDVQMRTVGERPMLLLPGIFPRYYGPLAARRGETAAAPTTVDIPYHLVEGYAAPALFLSDYFELDRDLSREVGGFALVFRMEALDGPDTAVLHLAEALVVATKYLLRQDPAPQVARLGSILKGYVEAMLEIRRRTAEHYGPRKGRIEEMNSSGLYVDALRGRCTACEDHAEAARYVDVMLRLEELRGLKAANALADLERRRRKARLDAGELDPFDAVPPFARDGAQEMGA